MDTLKGALSKGLTTLNVKTSNLMEETKCKTYISTLEKEIKDLKCKLGDLVYKEKVNGQDFQEKICEIINTIKDKENSIEEQYEIIKKLSEEEKQILGAKSTTNIIVPQVGAVFCKNCGAQSSTEYKFCTKCGTPLK